MAADRSPSLRRIEPLDALHPGRETTFTSVGYGLQASFPDAAARKDIAIRERMVAHPWLHSDQRRDRRC